MSKQVAILIALAVVFLSSQLVKEGSVVDQMSDPDHAAQGMAALEEQNQTDGFSRELDSTELSDQSLADGAGWSNLAEFSDPIDTAEGLDPTPIDEGGEGDYASRERDPSEAPPMLRPSTASDGVKIIYSN